MAPSRFLLSTLALPLLLGCTGSTTETAGDGVLFASGSRLRAHYYDGGDGAKALIDWMDTQTGEPCTFREAEDSQIRCLPTANGANQLYFADAACSQPIVLVTPQACAGQDSAFVFQQGGFDLCEGPTPTLYRKGAKIGLPATFYHVLPNGCAGNPTTAGQTAFTAEKVDLSTLPLAHVAPDTSTAGARIFPEIGVTDDGARQVVGALDSAAMRACAPVERFAGPMGGEALACTPKLSWAADFFADSNCTKPAAYADASPLCAPGLEVGYVPAHNACDPSTLAFYEVGATSMGYTGAPGACTPASTAHAFFGVGAPVDSATLPHFDERQLGTGRARVRALGDGTRVIAPAPSPIWRDETLGVGCTPQRVGSTTRCVQSFELAQYFADAECTKPIAEEPVSLPCNVMLPSMLATYDDACGAVTLYTRGAAYNGPIFQLQGVGVCNPLMTDTGVHYVEAGAPIDPSTLPELREVTE